MVNKNAYTKQLCPSNKSIWHGSTFTLDPNDPLLKLSVVIPWDHFDKTFSVHYKEAIGAPSKPIRLMVGLLLLNQANDFILL